jgi:SAM-dependent methyltransferase
MFFDDPAAAFANLRLWLRPGGRIVFACWRAPHENIWMSLPLDAARYDLSVMPTPDLEAPGPFAFARRERIASIMMQAELDNLTITPFDAMLRLGEGVTVAEATANALERVVQIGPLARILRENPTAVWAKVMPKVREALAAHAGPRGVILPAAAWIVCARRP